MLTYDKLKLTTEISNIKIKDKERFNKIVRNEKISSMMFTMSFPYSLSIKIDYIRDEAVLEFTGKILGKHYQQLISRETINECFENINRLGICEIKADAMMNSKVIICDVTKDIQYSDIPQLSAYIRSNLVNHQRYICQVARNGNLIISKNVMTKQYRKRLTIYDKHKEMLKSDNVVYMNHFGIDNNCFEGVCRFEINLNSQAQIKDSLHILNTTLYDVLYSTANPIRDFLNDVLADEQHLLLTDEKIYKSYLVLRDCDFDIDKVEMKMRGLHPSRGSSIKKIMQPYREMLIQMHDYKGRDMKQELLALFAA